MKINLSESAKLKMQEYFKNEVPLRLIVQGVSWCGPTFAVVSAKHLVEDKLYKEDGIELAIAENVISLLSEVKIDHSNKFFRKGFIVMPIPK